MLGDIASAAARVDKGGVSLWGLGVSLLLQPRVTVGSDVLGSFLRGLRRQVERDCRANRVKLHGQTASAH